MNLETKSMHFKAENLQDDGTFSGYASVFDVVDSYDEIVKKGAFVDSLNDWQAKGKMPPVLWQHDRSEVIGVWTKLYEDDKGLFGEGKLLIDDVAKAKEAYALIKAGAIDGLSIGYRTEKYRYNSDDDTIDLLKLNLKEVSIVTFPANEDSTVSNVKAQVRQDRDAQNALKILMNINQSF